MVNQFNLRFIHKNLILTKNWKIFTQQLENQFDISISIGLCDGIWYRRLLPHTIYIFSPTKPPSHNFLTPSIVPSKNNYTQPNIVSNAKQVVGVYLAIIYSFRLTTRVTKNCRQNAIFNNTTKATELANSNTIMKVIELEVIYFDWNTIQFSFLNFFPGINIIRKYIIVPSTPISLTIL